MKSIISFSIILALLLYFATGCKKEGGNENAVSSHGSNKSSNMSGNCQECHVSGGSGPGWFTAAGTVYTKDLSAVSPKGLSICGEVTMAQDRLLALWKWTKRVISILLLPFCLQAVPMCRSKEHPGKPRTCQRFAPPEAAATAMESQFPRSG